MRNEKATKVELAAFLLAGYAGYKFIDKTLGIVAKKDPIYLLGTKIAAFGFGSMLGGMAVNEISLLEKSIKHSFGIVSPSKPEGDICWEDLQEQGMNDAAEMAKENNNERESEAESGIDSVE